MNPYVVQILAMGLTVSQLFSKDFGAFRTSFSPAADQAKVQEIIHDGCGLVMGAFKAEKIDLDPIWKLILAPTSGNAAAVPTDSGDETVDPDAPAATATAKPAAPGSTGIAAKVAKMDPATLYAAYQSICLGKTIENSPVKLDEVIAYYNEAMKDLPDHHSLKNFKFREASVINDRHGNRITELYEDQNRRKFVALKNLPPYVAQAFISAEDRTFRQHKGLDLLGIIRAFMVGLTGSDGKRPPGGSTITQQVMKNVLLDSSLDLKRKMREMVLARRTEEILSKDEILELYLNYVFLGRASWGIDMAARSYFGKSAVDLTLSEAAFLAGINKGPNYYNPDKQPELTEGRRTYVLGRLAADQPDLADRVAQAKAQPPAIVAFEAPRRRGGFYFADEIRRQAKAVAGIESLTSGSYTIRTTMDPKLQKMSEKILQDNLAAYEARTGRAVFTGPVGSMAKEIETYKKPWSELIDHIRSRLYDVQWPVAVVLSTANKGRLKVGLQDGKEAWLNAGRADVSKLKAYDLVHVDSDKQTKSGQVQLKIPPRVQGAVVVLEAKTGRVLSMSGGFSYPGSPLNRATQTFRQPGSTIKPFAYLYALNQGLQPNTQLSNVPKPIQLDNRPPWAPGNYTRTSLEPVTMRTALENSLNIPTANMVAAIKPTVGEGLDGMCQVTMDLGVYQKCERAFPFVLGAQPARLIDMAVAYATIANLGLKPTAYYFDSIARDDQPVWRRPFGQNQQIQSPDRVSFYQMRRLMEGVISNGTAVALKDLSGYVAGKTGTSNNWNDAWFIGFTNDVVVATWIGYDNANSKEKRTLGDGNTGGKLALPIGAAILRYIVARDGTPLDPSPGGTVELNVDETTGTIGAGNSPEVFRRAGNGYVDSQKKILPPQEDRSTMARQQADGDDAGAPTDPYAQAMPQEYRTRDADQNQYYRPGQDDQYQSWRDQNRNVDPVFNGMFGRGY